MFGEIKAEIRGQVHCAILVLKYWNTYGHNLHDLLATILLFPKEILNMNPYIFHDWDNKNLEEHLDALGLYSIRIYPWQNDFVRCNDIYYIHPLEVAHEFSGYSLPKMHDMFRKRFKLESIIPTKYNVLNKKPNEARHFTNFVELQTVLNEKYKPIQWNIIELGNSLEEKGKQFAETLFLIASGGSIIYNALFMKEKSSIVVFFADLIDLPDLSLICILKMYGIGIQHQNMSHYRGSGTIYINKTLDAVEKLMYTMKNNNYPYMKGYRPSYNISLMKKQMLNNYLYKFGGYYNLPVIN